MNFLSIIGAICTVACISVILKKYSKEYSLLISVLLGLAVIFYLSAKFTPIFRQIGALITLAKVPEKYLSILLKCLGICFVTEFAADSCRDVGENSLASKIEIIGKVSILAAALPLFEEIIKTALDLMGAG